jgi:hypothetical protein
VAEALVCKTSLSGFESRRYLQKKKGPDHISAWPSLFPRSRGNDPLQQSATDKSGPFLDGTTPAIEFHLPRWP